MNLGNGWGSSNGGAPADDGWGKTNGSAPAGDGWGSRPSGDARNYGNGDDSFGGADGGADGGAGGDGCRK